MSENFDIAAHLAALSDEALIAATKEAKDDLEIAAREAPNSEHHEQCFAGLFVYTNEMASRGLRLTPLH
jgi:hypothetical protein